ncbi:MAG: recombinase family protein [Chloroflexi bacterium]|nr:recombinase family protein [Chloroflexota bacterium]
MRRCVLYSRVSTDAQERDGTSLDTQERASVEYAAAKGWTVVERVSDTASGFTLDRTGIDRVRELARSGGCDVVLTYALDRLSRKQTHIGILVDEMESLAVRLEFVTEKFEDTATGQLLRSVKAFAAEFEREKIAERTMRGKAERARSGRIPQATGLGLYGYRYLTETGRREIVPEQAVVVQGIFERFAAGVSLSGITRDLNETGVPTFTGLGSWRTWTVRNMLRNEAYAGRTIYRKTVASKRRNRDTGRTSRHVEVRPSEEWIEVPGATPAIVAESLFQMVQQRLSDPERRRKGHRAHEYPLSGRMRCAQCGSAMVGQMVARTHRYYRCRRAFSDLDGARCHSRYVRADALETGVIDELIKVLASPAVLVAEMKHRAEALGSGEPTADTRVLDGLERQRARLIKLYQLGEIDDAYLERELAALRVRKNAVDQASVRSSAPVMLPATEQLEALCQKVAGAVRGCVASGRAELVLQALDVLVTTERTETGISALVRGSIPEDCSQDYSPFHEHRHHHVHVAVVAHRAHHARA